MDGGVDAGVVDGEDARDVLADTVLCVQEGLCELVADLCGIWARGWTWCIRTGVAREGSGWDWEADSHSRHSFIFGDSQPSKQWPQVQVAFSLDMVSGVGGVRVRGEGRGVMAFGFKLKEFL